MQKAYAASRIFDGEKWLEDQTLFLHQGTIEKITATHDEAGPSITRSFTGLTLVPAFIDVQVYGAAGKLFSAFPTADTLKLMQETFSKQGAVLFQPTLATNTLDLFRQAIDAVRTYREQGGQGVHGLHLEGPWIHPAKRGAHQKEWIHEPTFQEVKDLLDYGSGVITMITLAPEVCPPEVLDLLVRRGIILSAGHSQASYRQAMEAFDGGFRTVTHLFNAMSPFHHREPGMVGATWEHPGVLASIIPDGHHVSYEVLAIAKKLMGPRLFAITDAVTETDRGPYQHQLAGDKYEADGILSGSSLSMYQAFYNLVRHAGVEKGEALRMCSLYPAKLLGVEHRYGRIAPGYAGQFLVLNDQLDMVDVII
ncbi:MAG: N-acetylglucosamine-6-phosphate deacetylase [Flavisolibacter sp.]